MKIDFQQAFDAHRLEATKEYYLLKNQLLGEKFDSEYISASVKSIATLKESKYLPMGFDRDLSVARSLIFDFLKTWFAEENRNNLKPKEDLQIKYDQLKEKLLKYENLAKSLEKYSCGQIDAVSKQSHNLSNLKNEYLQFLDTEIIAKDVSENEVANSLKNLKNTLSRMVQQGVITQKKMDKVFNNQYSIRVDSIDFDLLMLPNELSEFLDNDLAHEWMNIIVDLCNLNNSFVGTPMSSAFVALGYDNRSHNIKTRLFDFAERYCKKTIFPHYFNEIKTIYAFRNYIIRFWSDYYQNIEHLNKKQLRKKDNKVDNFIFYFLPDFYHCLKWYAMQYSNGGCVALHNSQFVNISDRMLALESSKTPEFLVQHKVFRSEQDVKIYRQEYIGSLKIINRSIYLSKQVQTLSTTDYKNDIQQMAFDLREIRTLLVKNYHPRKSIIAIPEFQDDLHMLWQWETNGDCLARVCFGLNGYDDMVAQTAHASRMDATYNLIIRINYDGMLTFVDSQWLTPERSEDWGMLGFLEANHLILSRFYNLFMQWFGKIKIPLTNYLQQIKTNATTDLETPSIIIDNNEVYLEDEDLVTLANQHYLEYSDQVYKKQSRFVQHMYASDFLKLLTYNFECKVTQGKGSEIKISRVALGGRVQRLGHHGKDVQLSSQYICLILKRLNIPINDWIMCLSV